LPGALMQLSFVPQQIDWPVVPVQGFGHAQVQVVGSSTWGAVQLATQALVAGQTSCPVGHSQAQVPWLRTLPPPQAGSQAWLPTQNSVPVGQPSQAQVLALNTVGSGQSNVVWGQMHSQDAGSTVFRSEQVTAGHSQAQVVRLSTFGESQSAMQRCWLTQTVNPEGQQRQTDEPGKQRQLQSFPQLMALPAHLASVSIGEHVSPQQRCPEGHSLFLPHLLPPPCGNWQTPPTQSNPVQHGFVVEQLLGLLHYPDGLGAADAPCPIAPATAPVSPATRALST